MVNFRQYRAWQKAHGLTLRTYRVSMGFPKDERFGLTAQIRRSVASIPTNMAEGCGRFGDRDRARFFNIALGSASEVEYQLLLITDLGYIEKATHDELAGLVIEVKKMLSSLVLCLKEGGKRITSKS